MKPSKHSPNWYWKKLGATVNRIGNCRQVTLPTGESFCAVYPVHVNEILIAKQLTTTSRESQSDVKTDGA